MCRCMNDMQPVDSAGHELRRGICGRHQSRRLCYKDTFGVAGSTARAMNKHTNGPTHARQDIITRVKPARTQRPVTACARTQRPTTA